MPPFGTCQTPRAAATALAVACLLAAVPVLADPPAAGLQLTGALRTAAGGPVADGSYGFVVRFYADSEGKDQVYKELFVGVPVTHGQFALLLGADPGAPMDGGAVAAGGHYVGIQIDADPEMPRVPLAPVLRAWRAVVADSALSAETAKTADSATEADHAKLADLADLATAAGQAKVADFATSANTAKQADNATQADFAKKADSATTADEAASAAALQCSGCVTSAMLAETVLEPYAKTAALHVVATSGKYADLEGGPDLSGYGQLTGANVWSGKNVFAGVDVGGNEVLGLRLQNADKAPVACDAAHAGMLYFAPAAKTLNICNGQAWFALSVTVGDGSAGSPAKTCKALRDADLGKGDGAYWLDPDGDGPLAPLQSWCDMSTDDGGWSLVARGKGGSTAGWGTTGALNVGAGTSLGATFKMSDARINAMVTQRYRWTYDGNMLAGAASGQGAWWYFKSNGCIYGHNSMATGSCDKAYGDVSLIKGPVAGTNGTGAYMGLCGGGPHYLHTHHAGPTWYIRDHHNYGPDGGSTNCNGGVTGCDVALWVR